MAVDAAFGWVRTDKIGRDLVVGVDWWSGGVFCVDEEIFGEDAGEDDRGSVEDFGDA